MDGVLYDIRGHYMSELKEMFELKKDHLTPECVEVIKNMVCTIKDIDTIVAMEENGGYSKIHSSKRILEEMMKAEIDSGKRDALQTAINNMR